MMIRPARPADLDLIVPLANRTFCGAAALLGPGPVGPAVATVGRTSLTVLLVNSFQGWNQYRPKPAPASSTAPTSQVSGLRTSRRITDPVLADPGTTSGRIRTETAMTMSESGQPLSVPERRTTDMEFSAVRTTGIYCRPGCGARPRADNVQTFEMAAAAEAAGYRACLRCRPYRDGGAVPWAAPEFV